MQNIVLVDDQERDHLLPFTFTRPVAEIRIGAFTISEKWTKRYGFNISHSTQPYLESIYPADWTGVTLIINGAVIPTDEVVKEIQGLKEGESLMHGTSWIATKSADCKNIDRSSTIQIQSNSSIKCLDRPWKIFQWNDWALREDFTWIKKNVSPSTKAFDGVTILGDDIVIEEGAVIRPCVINTETGPVFIAKGAEIMEGCLIRGGLALLEGAQLKMGAKIYGASTFGPQCRIGGEVNNSVIFGYSNKGHDGFIGNTVIGEWCNLGADTNTSNLKNNYSDVKLFSYALGRSESTGGQFCGLMMGDHSKSGINTMFNTGSVCGVFANIFGAGFPHRNIPDFGWGGADGFRRYRLADALTVAEKVMKRRNIELTEQMKSVYTHLFEISDKESS